MIDYNTIGAIDGHLTLKVGDTIIVKQLEADGKWAFGLCNGSQGRFPASYTKPTALLL